MKLCRCQVCARRVRALPDIHPEQCKGHESLTGKEIMEVAYCPEGVVMPGSERLDTWFTWILDRFRMAG